MLVVAIIAPPTLAASLLRCPQGGATRARGGPSRSRAPPWPVLPSIVAKSPREMACAAFRRRRCRGLHGGACPKDAISLVSTAQPARVEIVATAEGLPWDIDYRRS